MHNELPAATLIIIVKICNMLNYSSGVMDVGVLGGEVLTLTTHNYISHNEYLLFASFFPKKHYL